MRPYWNAFLAIILVISATGCAGRTIAATAAAAPVPAPRPAPILPSSSRPISLAEKVLRLEADLAALRSRVLQLERAGRTASAPSEPR